MKLVTTVTIDSDIKRLAELNNINISQFLNDALKAHLAQFDDPELQAVSKEIKSLEDKVQLLKCRQASIAAHNLNIRSWKKIITRHGAFDNWRKDYLEAKRTNDQGLYEKTMAEVIKKTGIPKDSLPSILDDVMSHLTS